MHYETPQVPQPAAGDAAHALAKAVLSTVPVVGGPAVELFQFLIQPPIERRRAKWMAQVGEKLAQLHAAGLNLQSLQSNEQFVSATLHATQIALRTHVDEKLTALRNALANVASGQAPPDAEQHYFFELVDSLTELHIQILKVAHAPAIPAGFSRARFNMVLEFSIRSLHGRRDLAAQFWRDLHVRGLVKIERIDEDLSIPSLANKRTTELGDQFLRFIGGT